MTRRRVIAAALIAAAGTVSFVPAASAGQVVVGIGIGLPGFALVAPAPVAVVASPYYYGPGYYGPAFIGGPLYGYGYYGRPYTHYAPRFYAHGYGGRIYHHH